MEIHKTLYVTSREEWRAWLTKHYQSETEVCLIYYKKHTDQPRISCDHAVEEALCFGWVDIHRLERYRISGPPFDFAMSI